MVARFDALRIAASDPSTLARFWAEVLGARTTTPVGGAGAAVDVEPQDATSVRLRFVPEQRPRAGRGWLHLHLTAASLEDQARVVGRCRALGAQHVDVGQLPEEDHVVLADPEGNELCVVREGSFLAGTGFLGEVACDGTRDVGLFWSAALGWPLVWDHDEETAVQSPAGGTKIAWGGPPLAEDDDHDRMYFDLVADGDLGAEVDRLVGLGATALGSTDGAGVALLADPDGQRFRLHRA